MYKHISYYEVLNISEDASAEDIRQSYRKHIKIWHPDLHPGDEQAAIKTQEINEAYGVLSDPVKRAKYDEYLSLTRPVFDGEINVPSDDIDDFDLEYGDMSFEEYAEHVSSGVNKAYKESSWTRSSKVNESEYREYAKYKKSVNKNEVNLLGLVRGFSIFIVIILIMFLIVNYTGVIPDLKSDEALPFPVLLLIIIFVVPVIYSFIKERLK